MAILDRREFMQRSAALVGAVLGAPALAGARGDAPAATRPAASRTLRANDVVTLGKTGIKPSRLAMGTGTVGGREQRALGIRGLVKLFRHGMDQGVCWLDTADAYRTHPHVAATLKEIPRDKVVITSKTRAKDADGMRKDLERFRRELGTDYLDIVLLHCMQDADWPTKMRGCMDVLSEAKQKGQVRAVGCSCHTFDALRAAANEPWVEIDLARINPYASHMDVSTPQEVSKVDEVLKIMHARGKVVYGMKILGEGDLKGDRIDESLRFVLGRPYVSAFTIGFGSVEQLDDMMRRIERISAS